MSSQYGREGGPGRGLRGGRPGRRRAGNPASQNWSKLVKTGQKWRGGRVPRAAAGPASPAARRGSARGRWDAACLISTG